MTASSPTSTPVCGEMEKEGKEPRASSSRPPCHLFGGSGGDEIPLEGLRVEVWVGGGVRRGSSAPRIGTARASAVRRLMRPIRGRRRHFGAVEPDEVLVRRSVGEGVLWGFSLGRLGLVPVRTGAAKLRTKDERVGKNSNPRCAMLELWHGWLRPREIGFLESVLSSSCLGWASWRRWYGCRLVWPRMTQMAIGVN